MSYLGNVDAAGELHLVASTLYGTCSTAANTAAKVVTLADYDALLNGTTVHVKFIYSNTAENATLNVNGTGAYPIYTDGVNSPGTTPGTSWPANGMVSFTFDGTAWRMNDSSASAVSELNADVSDLNAALNNKIQKATTAVTPSTTQQTYSLPGLTTDHELIRWNFVDSGTDVAENAPPCDLTWETGSNIWKLTAGSATSVTCQPVFAIPE